MRDAGRERADRGEPLRLHELPRHPSALGAAAQGGDPEGEVVREVAEELHLAVVGEGLHVGGVDREGAERLALRHERQRDHRGEAALLGVRSPGLEAGIGGDPAREDRAGRTDGRADGASSAVRVRPDDVHRGEIPVVVPRVRRGAHRSPLVLLRIRDPAQPVAALLHHGAAHLLEKGALVGGAHERLVAGAERAERPLLAARHRLRVLPLLDSSEARLALAARSSAVRSSTSSSTSRVAGDTGRVSARSPASVAPGGEVEDATPGC